MNKLLQHIRIQDKPLKNIMISGGGNIGFRLASTLENEYNIKLLELDQKKAAYAAEKLNNTIVLHGDATDEELLNEENIDGADVFCALTNADEVNIISSMLAKRLGARKVMALINKKLFLTIL